jgi:lipoprotein-anchoring transpeptidase ErfK/SrfK
MRLLGFSPHLRSLFAFVLLAGALAFAPNAKAEPHATDAQAESTQAGDQAEPAQAGNQAEPAQPGDQAEPAPPGARAESNPQAGEGTPAAKGESPEGADAGAQDDDGGSGSKVVINIDKSTQQMTVFVDGIERYEWPVSTGRAGYSTPSGTYTPTSMNEMWYSKQWDNSPMPHAIFFMKDGHAIHGTHEVRNLGKPASHGCVRISPADAAILYDLVKEKGMKNTQVALTGETPGGEAKVASQPAYPRYGEDAPWFGPGQGYYPQPQRRRGLFGRWFQPDDAPQGYYRPRGNYYQPRGAQGY